MYVYFNEKSAVGVGDREDLSDIVYNYAQLVKETIAQGFIGVRYEEGLEGIRLNDDITFKEYCSINVKKEHSLKVILATAKKPYIEDGDEQEDQFVNLDKCDVCLSEDLYVESFGLTAAYLYNSLGIGFDLSPWDKVSYTLRVVTDEITKNVPVYCVTKIEDFENTFVFNWLCEYLTPNLERTKLLPREKKIKLSDHHGYRELSELSDILIKDPYVVEIVNSIDHNSYTRSFVSNIPPEVEFLDLTLTETDKGYSLRVRTVARNRREQEYIAKILTERYS